MKNIGGIIAAVLGNKENQRKLIGCIWNGNSEKETYTLKQHLADYKPTEEEWLGVVSSFERKLSEVKAEKSLSDRFYAKCRKHREDPPQTGGHSLPFDC